MTPLISRPVVIWVCRILLTAYAAVILSTAYDLVSDWKTTVLLIGSDAECGMVPLLCSLASHIIDWTLHFATIALALGNEVAWRWRYRNHVRAGATLLTIGHFLMLRILMEIGWLMQP